MSAPLDPTAIRVVATVRHQLALGLLFIDAVSERAPALAVVAEVEQIGPFPTPGLRFRPASGPARQALVFRDEVRRLITLTVARGGIPAIAVRIYGEPAGGAPGWDARTDRRQLLPRRLVFTPVLTGGIPDGGTANGRPVSLWPGPAAPLSGATVLRGRVVDAGGPVPWARIVATRPNGAVVGHGGTDHRGEFVIVLRGGLTPGASLPVTATVRLTAHAPAGRPAADLSGVPLETAGILTDGPVLRGETIPPAYTRTATADVTLDLSARPPAPATTLTLP